MWYNYNINNWVKFKYRTYSYKSLWYPNEISCRSKLNSDDTVFGDYSSIKTDGTKIFKV